LTNCLPSSYLSSNPVFQDMRARIFLAENIPTAAYKRGGVVESGEKGDEELRRAAQNPMADLMSFPVRNDTNFGYEPLDKHPRPGFPFNLLTRRNVS
jgi:hypothetical protein